MIDKGMGQLLTSIFYSEVTLEDPKFDEIETKHCAVHQEPSTQKLEFGMPWSAYGNRCTPLGCIKKTPCAYYEEIPGKVKYKTIINKEIKITSKNCSPIFIGSYELTQNMKESKKLSFVKILGCYLFYKLDDGKKHIILRNIFSILYYTFTYGIIGLLCIAMTPKKS